MFMQNKAVLAVFLTTVASTALAQAKDVVGEFEADVKCVEGYCKVKFQVKNDGSLNFDRAEINQGHRESTAVTKPLADEQAKSAANYVITSHLSQFAKEQISALTKLRSEKLSSGACKDIDLDFRFSSFKDGTTENMHLSIRDRANGEYIISSDLPWTAEKAREWDYSLEKVQKEIEDACTEKKADRAARPSFKTVTGSDKPGH